MARPRSKTPCNYPSTPPLLAGCYCKRSKVKLCLKEFYMYNEKNEAKFVLAVKIFEWLYYWPSKDIATTPRECVGVLLPEHMAHSTTGDDLQWTVTLPHAEGYLCQTNFSQSEEIKEHRSYNIETYLSRKPWNCHRGISLSNKDYSQRR